MKQTLLWVLWGLGYYGFGNPAHAPVNYFAHSRGRCCWRLHRWSCDRDHAVSDAPSGVAVPHFVRACVPGAFLFESLAALVPGSQLTQEGIAFDGPVFRVREEDSNGGSRRFVLWRWFVLREDRFGRRDEPARLY